MLGDIENGHQVGWEAGIPRNSETSGFVVGRHSWSPEGVERSWLVGSKTCILRDAEASCHLVDQKHQTLCRDEKDYPPVGRTACIVRDAETSCAAAEWEVHILFDTETGCPAGG